MSKAHDATAKPRFRPEFQAKIAKLASARAKPSHRAKIGKFGIRGSRNGKIEEGAIVEIVIVEVAELEPGVTLTGENTHS
jgi:hypothetical protein